MLAHIVFVTPLRRLLVASQGSVLRSIDRGKQWHRVGLLRDVFSFVSTTSGAILAATNQGIFRSVDDGETWSERSLGLSELIGARPNESFRIRALAAGTDGTIYAATQRGDVFGSTDLGDRWRPFAPPIRGLESLLVTKTGDLLAAGHSGLFRWERSDGVWRPIAMILGRQQPQVNVVVQHPGGVLLAGTEDQGVLASFDDGTTWEAASGGLTARAVYSLAIDALGTVFAGTSQGVFTSTNVR